AAGEDERDQEGDSATHGASEDGGGRAAAPFSGRGSGRASPPIDASEEASRQEGAEALLGLLGRATAQDYPRRRSTGGPRPMAMNVDIHRGVAVEDLLYGDGCVTGVQGKHGDATLALALRAQNDSRPRFL